MPEPLGFWVVQPIANRRYSTERQSRNRRIAAKKRRRRKGAGTNGPLSLALSPRGGGGTRRGEAQTSFRRLKRFPGILIDFKCVLRDNVRLAPGRGMRKVSICD